MIRIARSLAPTYQWNDPSLPTCSDQPISRWRIYSFALLWGVNYFNHGITRIDDIPGFSTSMVKASLVPPVELLVGLLLIAGLFTRASLIATFILMVILMYGVTIVQNWSAASSQLIYNIVLFILLAARTGTRQEPSSGLWLCPN